MDYNVVTLEDLNVIGTKRSYTSDENVQQEIPKFWAEFNQSGHDERLIQLSNGKVEGFLGICIPNEQGVDYYIAVSSDETSNDWESQFIPGGKYLVFQAKGPVPDEIQRVTNEAFQTIQNSPNYELRKGPEIELYRPGNIDSPEYITDIMIAIK
nr:effector binding domain-containing protein [Mammaliicoccus sp. Marseille-Q6498]